MEDRIEQRIAIRSTQDKVWRLVARPGWWLPGCDAAPAAAPGRQSVRYGSDPRPYVIDVIRVEPPGYISFRWSSAFGGGAPAPGHATMVEFYVRPLGDEIGVTMVESGFSQLDLPEALREDQWQGSRGGWAYELASLRTQAEQDRLPLAILAGCSGIVQPETRGSGDGGGLAHARVSAWRGRYGQPIPGLSTYSDEMSVV